MRKTGVRWPFFLYFQSRLSRSGCASQSTCQNKNIIYSIWREWHRLQGTYKNQRGTTAHEMSMKHTSFFCRLWILSFACQYDKIIPWSFDLDAEYLNLCFSKCVFWCYSSVQFVSISITQQQHVIWLLLTHYIIDRWWKLDLVWIFDL